MNLIDNKIPLSEQFQPIDFASFQCGDEYVIARKQNDELRYTTASIGYFRHGIAIANTSNGDCLINTHCEIIFEERASSRRSNITIERVFDGFKISWEEDVAAPGKDFHWQDQECIIPEHQIAANAYKIYDVNLYDYPSGIIPPERGLIIRFGNNFYDFETYNNHLFTIPATLQICKESRYNIHNVYSDCDYIEKEDVQIYTKDEFDSFIVKDSEYYKNIIVKVQDSKIVSWYPLPCFEEQPLKDISYQNYEERIDIDPFKGLKSDKYIQYIFSEDTDNRELCFNIDSTFNLFRQFPELKIGIDAFRDIRYIFGKEYVGVVYGERIQLIIRLLDAGFVLFNYSDYRGKELSKFYVFNKDGDILNLSGYDDIDVALLTSELLLFKREDNYGIANIGVYDSKIELRERIIYTYDKESESKRETPINPPVGIAVVGRPIDCRRLRKQLLGDRFYLRDTEQEQASAIGIYKWKAEGLGFIRDFSNATFYAGLPYQLSKINVDEELGLSPLIEGYLYQLPNKHKVSKYVKICNQIYYRECYRAYYSTDTIKHATEESIEKTQKRLNKCCSKGNPYVVRIKEIKKLSDSYTQYYLFEYRPFGRIDNKGNITYEYGNPEKIEL